MILGSMAGMTALPFWPSFSAASGDVDVVVIGAGIAGVTAAQDLLKEGLSVTVVEARDRIGGRAYTESDTFGVPYDHGCAWLHSANKNPLTKLVRNAGFETYDEEDKEWWLYLDGDEADDDGYEALEDAYESLERAMERIEDKDNPVDTSVYEARRPKDRFGRIAHAISGPFEYGEETDRVSVLDVQSQIGTGVEWMVPQGMGAAIFKALGPVPVSLKTTVSKVDWGGKTIKVETSKGTLTCKAIVSTVPTEIIADGTIAFSPALPDWKTQACRDVPMGVLDKIALQFNKNVFDEAEGNTVYEQDGADGQIWDHLVRPFDLNLTVTFLGGDFSRDLTKQGDQAAFDVALDSLVNIFGSSVRGAFVKGHYTKWDADPFARGAYSYAKPGKHKSRKKVAAPVDDRLFFAGEACDQKWATQAAAAYLTGQRAAKSIVSELT